MFKEVNFCGIAINPSTHENAIEYLYEYADYFLVMEVEPGFAGQDFVKSTALKVKNIRKQLEKRKIIKDIYIDGHVDERTVFILSKAGANVFIGGSAGLFKKNSELKDNYNKLKGSLF